MSLVMSLRKGTRWILAGGVAALWLATPLAVPAQEGGEAAAPDASEVVSAPQAKSLDELLELVRQGFQAERAENTRRIEEFTQAKERQKELLAEARVQLASLEALSGRLEDGYNTNEITLAEMEARLTERLGEMGELFGVVRQVSTDMSGYVWDSLTSSELGSRRELLERLGRSKELPSTEDLENLWYELQREMTAQGDVSRYQAPVLTTEGVVEQREVIRAGPFSAVSNGKYLLWEVEEQKLRELTRQPPSRYVNTVDPFIETESGFGELAVDPSRGSLLNALTDTPGFVERINQGGYVGYVIISLGLFALVLGVARWVVITITSRKVESQRKASGARNDNPLGRILGVHEENRDVDAETLELKLDEAVLRESSKLERFLWLVKTVSVVAPLLGLLGTVTGMIQTFQAITLFGAGDPKMMAGGISEALVTTMLGLTTAIPLVLLHATLSNSTRRIIDILDEQSAGLIATRAEHGNV